MDFRQFFDGFFRLNEELGNFFEEPLMNKDIFFGNIHENQQNISPRDMMLKPKFEKNSEGPSSLLDLLNQGENLFRSSSFEQTFNSDPNVRKA